jgi:hypothetical protein
MEREDSFVDPAAPGKEAEVIVAEDRNEPGEWRVEWCDEADVCYVTYFAGPIAEERARAYFSALKWCPKDHSRAARQ